MSLSKPSLFSSRFIACLAVFLATGTLGWGNQANHTVFLTESDVVMGMGSNEYGQLGLPVVRETSSPIQSKFGVRQISAGNAHAVYLMWDGTVWATGCNFSGQLGDGSDTNRTNPVQVVDAGGSPITGVVGVSAGTFHTTYLKSDGTVWATGKNQHGRLGDGTTTDRNNSVQVVDAGGSPFTGVVAISAGASHTTYLKSDGTVWATGRNDSSQLGDGSPTHRSNPVQVVDAGGSPITGVIGISAGDFHTMYLKSDGTVWAAGNNLYGRLGDGTTTSRSAAGHVVDAGGSPITGVVAISAGEHSTYLKSDGTVWAIGNNVLGQLGDGTTTHRSNPVQVVDAGGSPFTGVVGISAGFYQTTYLKSDGTVWAAGRNNYGQLGDGTTTSRSNPVQVVDAGGSPFTGVAGISAGPLYTTYLKSDGTVWAAGRNDYGQLGDGTTTDRSNPVRVLRSLGGDLSDVVQVSAGIGQTVMLKADGTVWASGRNVWGQLGDGTTTDRSNPVQVVDSGGSPLTGVSGIHAGGLHTVFLKSDGTVWAAGKNGDGQLGDGATINRSNPVQVVDSGGSPFTGVTRVSTGPYHTVYLKSDGTVWAAGSNNYGQLGDGTTIDRSNPVQVVDSGGNALSDVHAVAAGFYHTVYLKTDGKIWTVGRNGGGQLGDGTTTDRINPVRVVDSGGSPFAGVSEIAAWDFHTVFLKSNGTVWATGKNSDGRLGDGTTIDRSNPVQVVDSGGSPVTGVVGISAGDLHTKYLKSDGTLWGTGNNSDGQLGDGTTTNRTNPVQVVDSGGAPITGVSMVSAGGSHTVYLKADGTVMTVGANGSGQLGDGTTTDRSNPVQVVHSASTPIPFPQISIKATAAGYYHTVNLKSDGTVWAVGKNSSGQLGDGTTTNRPIPVQVVDSGGNPLTGVVGISASEAHTTYLKSDGTVWATGKNQYGQLGDGTTTDRSNPVQVMDAGGSPITGVVGIAAGGNHTTFLKSDGTVWAAGRNDYGQLGDGTTTERLNPMQVVDAGGSPLTGVEGISAGANHTMCLKSDGTVWAVGLNNAGQLGDGSNVNRSNPVQVVDAGGSSLNGVVRIAMGQYHSTYLKSDGTVWAAGRNYYGQLGDGTTVTRNNAVQVVDSGGNGLSGVVGIAAGYEHTVYFKGEGMVWSVGLNTCGQLGDGTTTHRSNPVQVVDSNGNALGGVVGIAPGYQHTVYLKSDGTVWSVGLNTDGQLGDGGYLNPDRLNPFQILDTNGTSLTGASSVSAGASHTTYLKSDGTVWATGLNSQGQLGDGTTTDRSNPVQVVDAGGSPFTGVVEISAGYLHSTYLKSDGSVWATGMNSQGQLGDGTTTNRNNPVQVVDAGGSPFTAVVGISAGQNHTMYLKSDGSVWATGHNGSGQLGDGTTTNRSNPVQVVDTGGSPFTAVVGISAGYLHTTYLKSDGTVWATGGNTLGQLGDGTTTNRSNPVQVVDTGGSPFTAVVGISAGYLHTTYLKSDGSVWATGMNSQGQLGDGTTTNRSNPVQVVDAGGSPIAGVVGISAGQYHTTYLKSDGTLWATGKNDKGQLGDLTTTNRSNPIPVYYGVKRLMETPYNHFPMLLTNLSPLTFAENQPIGTVVGDFNATDLDVNATLTYHLVSGAGDGNNALFTLEANGTLKTATTFDYETNASTYSIRVQAKDEHNASVEGNFTVTLTDLSYEPSQPNHTVDLNSTVAMDMLWVPAGTFTMGSPTSEAGRQSDREDEHNVTLTKGFYLGKYEVTQAQYEAVMTGNTNSLSATPSEWPGNTNRPVEKVSWDDAQVFLTRLNAQQAANLPAGWSYVLPTESQWEYACRAGTTTVYSWGATIANSNANYSSSGIGLTVDVGQYAANPWGFFDMHGNVWEWTADRYQAAYPTGNPVVDPTGPASGSDRVGRGGSWRTGGPLLRSARRDDTTPSRRDDNLGFRVAYKQTNNNPTNLATTALLTVAENQPIGMFVGDFNATDPDAGATLTYHLVSGVGDGNNTLFTLETNGTLKTATTFDYETNASTYFIRVQAKDEFNATVEGNFTVTLTDVNESPANLSSTVSLTIAENQPIGTVAGIFNATDPDAGASLTYFLVAGAGDANNLLFDLNASAGALTSKVVFDYENNATSYSIRVQAKDEYNATVEGSFSVSLTNRAESVNGRNLAGFTNAANLFGLSSSAGYASVAWGDYDGNGHLDLYLSQNGKPNKLFSNPGVGLFSDLAPVLGVDQNESGDCSWIDFDADGDLDLCQIASNGFWLWRNDAGSFTEVALSLGLSSVPDMRGYGWFDYDGDEDLDLFITSKTASNKLFKQQTNGTFSEVGSSAGVSAGSSAMEVAVCDYDNDGWPDLIISGRYSTKRLMRNNGDGTFTNQASSAGVSSSKDSHGVDWADFDGDGDFDLHVSNWNGANEHFRNNGNGNFTEIASSVGVDSSANISDASHADYDGDGDPDLFLSNIGIDYLFRNDEGNFTTEVRGTTGVGIHWSTEAYGVPNWIDFDGDGDLEFYMPESSNHMYQNLLNPSSDTYLKVRLVRSNGGLGAPASTVRLYYDSNGSLIQTQHTKQARVRSPQGPYNLLFQGLNPAVGYRVEVTFPGGAKGFSGPVSPNGQTPHHPSQYRAEQLGFHITPRHCRKPTRRQLRR